MQLLLINLDSSDSSTHVNLPGADAAFVAWTLSSGGDPFSELALLNGEPLNTTVDVATADPATFLSAILQPAQQGHVLDGIDVTPLSTAFVCIL